MTTTKESYFGAINETEKNVIIDFAYQLIDGDQDDPNALAMGYIRARLCKENQRKRLSIGLVESVTETPEINRLIRTYEALLPEAERRAKGEAIYSALEQLIAPQQTDKEE